MLQQLNLKCLLIRRLPSFLMHARAAAAELEMFAAAQAHSVIFDMLQQLNLKCLLVRRLVTCLTHVNAPAVADKAPPDSFDACKCCNSCLGTEHHVQDSSEERGRENAADHGEQNQPQPQPQPGMSAAAGR
jgi:hypothetical protein